VNREHPVRTLIMGAGGRDFHDFNLVYRDDPDTRVVAFTAAQIPDIAGRRYPPELAGPRYPQGIPILEEAALEQIIDELGVERVVFAYSDVSHGLLMHTASRVLAAGADFVLLGPARTMIRAEVPVIAVSAVRTGCGKSQTCRWLSRRLRRRGLRLVVIRHPMPYGDLVHQGVQRFASRADLTAAECTVEEREEYEPHIAIGNVVMAGIDYERIAKQAAAEADLILWDGGNNDFPFLEPDLHIVLVDPLRAGDETGSFPGEAVLRTADVVVIAKADCADPGAVVAVERSVREIRPVAPLVHAGSPVTLDDPGAVRGRRVLVVEDGPTITHGGMAYGAGLVAARAAGAAEIVDPRRSAAPAIRDVYQRYPHIGPVLPAVGYNPEQCEALRATIQASDADLVVAATPCALAELLGIDKPLVCARYEYAELDEPGLGERVDQFLARILPGVK
jgi:predicted GTPase